MIANTYRTLVPGIEKLIELALEEDLGRGDATTEATLSDIDKTKIVRAQIVAREQLVCTGLEVAARVFQRVDATISTEIQAQAGEVVSSGQPLMVMTGPAHGLLQAERTALNFLQRLSGIANLSRQYAQAVAGTKALVVDTRKTTPGFRFLEKQAVRDGGCNNHRFDLASGVLIKDNHIVACGGDVAKAVSLARKNAPHSLRIEVEVDTQTQLLTAIDAGADIVLLDNMTPSEVAVCSKIAHDAKVTVEVSGGITLDTVRQYAEAGADIISCGALTHSAGSADIALDFV